MNSPLLTLSILLFFSFVIIYLRISPAIKRKKKLDKIKRNRTNRNK